MRELKEKIRPVVKSPTYKKFREGRGFSLAELNKVGLNFKKAIKLGIPIDKRRKSCHEENVHTLKKLLDELKAQ